MQRGFALPVTAAANSGRERPLRQQAWRVIVQLAAAMVMLLGFAGCGGSVSEAAGTSTELRVFAAASLTGPFTAIGDAYMEDHPGVRVTFNFAGSQELATQLEQNAPADVLATADERTMQSVGTLVDEHFVFAGNSLQIAVAQGNPLGIDSLADLMDRDLKVVLAAPEVPAGKYASEVLAAAGVSVKPVSLEDNVKGVVTKVSLGEADAGIAYATDVMAAGAKVGGVAIPAAVNIRARYPIAVVSASENATAAQAFVDLVLSPEGLRILRDAGFISPAAK